MKNNDSINVIYEVIINISLVNIKFRNNECNESNAITTKTRYKRLSNEN